MPEPRILVGEIGRPHGVRGLVKIHAFTTEPSDIASYGPLTDAEGVRTFALGWLGGGVARIEGVADRDAAARLTGTRLYVAREKLPPVEEEEFYLADLVGLDAETVEGEPQGRVVAVEDFGAGPFLTLRDAEGRETLLPFTRTVVPVVNVAGGKIQVVLPDEVIVQPEAGENGLSEEPATAIAGASPLPRRSQHRRNGGQRDAAD